MWKRVMWLMRAMGWQEPRDKADKCIGMTGGRLVSWKVHCDAKDFMSASVKEKHE